MRVRMEHPKLPGQPVYVRPQALAYHRAAGWHEAPEPDPEPEPAPEPEPKSSRRRRAVTTEEESHGADAA